MRRSVAIIGTRGYPSYYGGFETAVRKIAPYLAERGWDVTVYSRAQATRVDDPERDHRVKVVYTGGLETKSISTISYGFTAARHAVKSKPDVALVMNVANGYFLPLLSRAGIPTLVNVDGIEWERAKWGRAARLVFRHGARFTARWATSLIFDAREIEKIWLRVFRRGGWFIPYGGDPVGAVEVEPGYRSGEYALIVARFVPENTVQEFVEAARLIARTHKVIFVGATGYGGELDESVRSLSASEPNVAWFGHVSDDNRLHALWRHAGAYFHGHSVGGTNPALVQAMSAGAPVVARDTVYNREVLGPDGVFVQPDPASIANAIVSVLENQRRQDQARKVSLERAASEYTWESVCRRYEEALLALLDVK